MTSSKNVKLLSFRYGYWLKNEKNLLLTIILRINIIEFLMNKENVLKLNHKRNTTYVALRKPYSSLIVLLFK